MDTKALEHRRKIKAKKPTFLRQDSHKRAKFKPASYRKPRGLHSKMRLGLKSYAQKVQVGYRSPVAVRGVHRSGLVGVIVGNIAQLDAIDRKTQGAIIGGTVGAKRRELLLKHAKEQKITILNFKIDDQLKAIGAKVAARKSEHEKKLSEKQQKEAAKKKTVEERVAKDEKKSAAKAPVAAAEETAAEEEKEQAFEDEKQKVLTKRT